MSDREGALAATVSPGFARHVLTRTIVLPEERVLFLPIPKAGCTSVLWQLAELAGLDEEDFARSVTPEVSPALTVHDVTIWNPQNRFSEYDESEREEMLAADDWLRFTIVRNPATRLWSAWQSKLLLREPRFVQTFGEEPWFPAMPEDPEQIVADFRAFVAAVGAGGAEDVHWAVQQELVEQLSFTHVGRMEAMDDTLALLREHVGEGRLAEDPPAENPTPLSLPPGVYDESTAAVLQERYGPDFEAFGYDVSDHIGEDGSALGQWGEDAKPILPVLRSTIGDHMRVEHLLQSARRLLKRVQTAEDDYVEREAQRVGYNRAPAMRNAEGNAEFNVRWGWAGGAELDHGFTAVLRVKNEARTLPYTLPPLLRAVRKLVIVDNDSTDGTPGVARRAAAEAGMADKLTVHTYPFSISRCGAEHLGTPGDSVHSLAYFYNWSFQHVKTTYALKWDGDMVLSDDAVEVLRDLEWQLEAGRDVIIRVPRYPLYLSGDDKVAFLDTGLRNNEPWGWPNKPGYSFVKALEWEMPLWEQDLKALVLPDWGCVELKFLDEDEFGHWTDTNFERSTRQTRKQREFEVFQALRRGGTPPSDVVRIEAPPGESVVEHIRTVWLPARAREELSLV